MKLTVSKSKNSATFYVQKSIRKSNGSVTTVTIEKLGNLDMVKTRANGKDPYIWAQEYVDELNRKEYEEQKEILIKCSPSKLLKPDEKHLFNCGYLFLQSIYYSLNLDKICSKISKKYSFEYDLNDILSRLIFTRILYPSSKLASNRSSKMFIEQPTFNLHDIYRSLSVLAKESDFIQSELYKNSQIILPRRNDILYYDCTNYYFEIEQEDELRKYGKSKQHQPLPIVGMGMFMDHDGIPLAFDIFPGNKNEQPTLKPLEQKVIDDYGIDSIIICTDAGLSSNANRKFNDKTLFGERIRSFITTQSIKQLPKYLKEFALDPEGWSLQGETGLFNLNNLNEQTDYNKVFYKERWIKEDLSNKKVKEGDKALEQHLIVSFSLKYKKYHRKIRQSQIDRANKLIEKGEYKRNQKTKMIHAVCTNLETTGAEEIVRINKKRWEIEECFRIMKTEFSARPIYLQREDRIKAHFITCFASLVVFRILEKKLGEQYTCDEIINVLRSMMMYRPGEKLGYLPAYTRTAITDALHEAFGFRTDYEILTDLSMKKVFRDSKKSR